MGYWWRVGGRLRSLSSSLSPFFPRLEFLRPFLTPELDFSYDPVGNRGLHVAQQTCCPGSWKSKLLLAALDITSRTSRDKCFLYPSRHHSAAGP